MNFSFLNLYGNRDVFQRMKNKGYSKVSFGRGEWIDDERIIAIFLFHNSDSGLFATYQYPKYRRFGKEIYGEPFVAVYSKDKFKDYLKDKRILIISKSENLKKILEKWK